MKTVRTAMPILATVLVAALAGCTPPAQPAEPPAAFRPVTSGVPQAAAQPESCGPVTPARYRPSSEAEFNARAGFALPVPADCYFATGTLAAAGVLAFSFTVDWSTDGTFATAAASAGWIGDPANGIWERASTAPDLVDRLEYDVLHAVFFGSAESGSPIDDEIVQITVSTQGRHGDGLARP